ncbi:MAG: hypothetical protein GC200_02680 [Tepidisphaera sp.]|nr:hypothetical protein [Tepidisphaera sp.]
MSGNRELRGRARGMGWRASRAWGWWRRGAFDGAGLSRGRGAIGRAMVAALLLTWLGLTPAAWGQRSTVSTGYYDPDTSFRPELSPRDVHVIVTVLGLKPEEVAAVNTLYDGYTSELATGARAVMRDVGEAIEKAEVMEDARLLGPADSSWGKWRTQADDIKVRFLEDLKSLLTKDQEARWPLVERELRRFKLIGNGRIAGESVDLTRVADEVVPKVWENPEAAQVLEEYAATFDRALMARETAAGRFGQGKESWSKLVEDEPTKAEEAFQDVLRVRRALRDVNQRYERQLEGKLSDEEAAKLRDAIFEKSFPRLFKETYSQRYIEAACNVESLTPEQRARAIELRQGYVAAVRAWRTRAAGAMVEYETQDYPQELLVKLGKIPAGFADGFQGYSFLPEDHPLRKVRLDRYALDKESREKMQKILSPEQRRGLAVQPESTASFTDYSPYTP